MPPVAAHRRDLHHLLRVCPAGPETAGFGGEARPAPVQKHHTNPIYYGKR
jgi:hypothetical protein